MQENKSSKMFVCKDPKLEEETEFQLINFYFSTSKVKL